MNSLKALSHCDQSDLLSVRNYRTAYVAFWSVINWKLPDGVLAEVWSTDRGNIRARRVRLRKGPPRWRQCRDDGHPVFIAAIELEKLKSKKFTGPRPAGPYPTSKGTKMSIPVQVSLELLRYGDEGEPAFCLTFELLNANGKSLTAAIDVDYKWEHPTISNEVDFLGLQDHDRRALTLAAYEKMVNRRALETSAPQLMQTFSCLPDFVVSTGITNPSRPDC